MTSSDWLPSRPAPRCKTLASPSRTYITRAINVVKVRSYVEVDNELLSFVSKCENMNEMIQIMPTSEQFHMRERFVTVKREVCATGNVGVCPCSRKGEHSWTEGVVYVQVTSDRREVGVYVNVRKKSPLLVIGSGRGGLFGGALDSKCAD